MLILSDCRYCPCCLVTLPLTSYNLTKDPPHDHDMLHTTFRNTLIVRGNHIPGGATHWPIVRNASGLTSPCGYLWLCLVLTASLVCRLLVCGRLLYAVYVTPHPTSFSWGWAVAASGIHKCTHTFTTKVSLSTHTFTTKVSLSTNIVWKSVRDGNDSGVVRTHLCTPFLSAHYITLRYITLHYITFHYVTLRYVTLRYVMLCYITLHGTFFLTEECVL